jgi:hypothetical protein
MVHLFPHFLNDDSEYAQAQAYWEQIWKDTSAADRTYAAWRSGWFNLSGPNDGNPIFTAVSELERKGIRAIQYAPSSNELELDFWLDTFGGAPTDPDAIQELVIVCSLSVESAIYARNLISAWLVGPIELANSSNYHHAFPAVVSANRQRWQELTSHHLTPAA